MTDDERSTILPLATTLLSEVGGEAVCLGPDSVGVQGDARFIGPCMIIRLPPNLPHEEIGRISTKIINEIKGVSRVLLDITPT